MLYIHHNIMLLPMSGSHSNSRLISSNDFPFVPGWQIATTIIPRTETPKKNQETPRIPIKSLAGRKVNVTTKVHIQW